MPKKKFHDLLVDACQKGILLDLFPYKTLLTHESSENQKHLAHKLGRLYSETPFQKRVVLLQNLIEWMSYKKRKWPSQKETKPLAKAFLDSLSSLDMDHIVREIFLLINQVEENSYIREYGVLILCQMDRKTYQTIDSYLLSLGNQISFSIRMNLLLFFSQEPSQQKFFDVLCSRFGSSTLIEAWEMDISDTADLYQLITAILLSTSPEIQNMFYETLKSFLLRQPDLFCSFLHSWLLFASSQMASNQRLISQLLSLMVFSININLPHVTMIVFRTVEALKPDALVPIFADRKMKRFIAKYMNGV